MIYSINQEISEVVDTSISSSLVAFNPLLLPFFPLNGLRKLYVKYGALCKITVNVVIAFTQMYSIIFVFLKIII